MRVGDVVTVKISIKDKATLDNTSERKRDSKRNLGFDTNYDLNLPFIKGTGDGKLDANVNSGTSTKGEGAITAPRASSCWWRLWCPTCCPTATS